MNTRGQMGIMGFVMMFMTIIVGLVLLVPAAQNIGSTTNTVSLANTSIGASPAAGASAYILTDYKSISDVAIYNATGTLVPATNYTISNNQLNNGVEQIQLTVSAVNSFAEQSWNVTGTAQPLTYDTSSGGRTIAGLIVLFFALAIGIIAIPNMRDVLGFKI